WRSVARPDLAARGRRAGAEDELAVDLAQPARARRAGARLDVLHERRSRRGPVGSQQLESRPRVAGREEEPVADGGVLEARIRGERVDGRQAHGPDRRAVAPPELAASAAAGDRGEVDVSLGDAGAAGARAEAAGPDVLHQHGPTGAAVRLPELGSRSGV